VKALLDKSPEERAGGLDLVVVRSRSAGTELAHSTTRTVVTQWLQVQQLSSCAHVLGVVTTVDDGTGVWLEVVDNEASFREANTQLVDFIDETTSVPCSSVDSGSNSRSG